MAYLILFLEVLVESLLAFAFPFLLRFFLKGRHLTVISAALLTLLNLVLYVIALLAIYDSQGLTFHVQTFHALAILASYIYIKGDTEGLSFWASEKESSTSSPSVRKGWLEGARYKLGVVFKQIARKPYAIIVYALIVAISSSAVTYYLTANKDTSQAIQVDSNTFSRAAIEGQNARYTPKIESLGDSARAVGNTSVYSEYKILQQQQQLIQEAETECIHASGKYDKNVFMCKLR